MEFDKIYFRDCVPLAGSIAPTALRVLMLMLIRCHCVYIKLSTDKKILKAFSVGTHDSLHILSYAHIPPHIPSVVKLLCHAIDDAASNECAKIY